MGVFKVLIYPYWNVNMEMNAISFDKQTVLIYPYWNLGSYLLVEGIGYVLIHTGSKFPASCGVRLSLLRRDDPYEYTVRLQWGLFILQSSVFTFSHGYRSQS